MSKKGYVITKIIAAGLPVVLCASVLLMRPYKVMADYEMNAVLVRISAVSQEDIDSKKNERDRARQEAAGYANQAESLKTERGNLTGELEKLNGLSEEQFAQYEEISRQLAAALIAKANALDEYVQAQENLENTKLLFSERISKMFEYQNKSTLEVLLESDSIAGFFTNIEMISLIADADDQAVDKMQIALDEAKNASDYALKEAEDMEEISKQKQAQLKELEDRIGKTEAALEDVSTKISYLEQQERDLDAYATTLDSQIADLQNQLYAQQQAEEEARRKKEEEERAKQTEATTQSTPDVTQAPDATATPKPVATATPVPQTDNSHKGTLQWPTWCTWVTSEYGYRTHPIYGDTRFHAGIDIGANMGDTVMAAASGTVITVDYPYPDSNDGGDSGYGNYVVIDHGNGISTLYAHMRRITVSNGSYVSAGSSIGEVGDTGGSRGAHLHFEVRVYGSPVDPRSYLP